jgi:serine/threonine protein kinase
VHVDIKSDNVLVYDSPGNNSENWAVKLSDFGNSLPNIATNDDHALPVRGTALYCAPELDAQRVSQSDLLLPKAIDIWSWGMLLWEVINDGKDYKDSADKRISWEDMQQLREEGLVSRIARDSVLKRLKSRHAQDIARDHGGMLTDIILQCLEDALQREPNQRISAHELLCRLQEVLRQEE